jgi:hypothetical protein
LLDYLAPSRAQDEHRPVLVDATTVGYQHDRRTWPTGSSPKAGR